MASVPFFSKKSFNPNILYTIWTFSEHRASVAFTKYDNKSENLSYVFDF